jgi:hypothetical protein
LDIWLKSAITIVTMAIVGGAISSKSIKRDTRQQSRVMIVKTIVATALINRSALSFLWFVVEYGEKDHCHGQLDEQRLSFLLLVDTSF